MHQIVLEKYSVPGTGVGRSNSGALQAYRIIGRYTVAIAEHLSAPTLDKVRELEKWFLQQEKVDLHVLSIIAQKEGVAARGMDIVLGDVERGLSGTKEFVINVLPGVGTAVEFYRHGATTDFYLSLAGDAAFFVGGGLAKVAASRGAAKTAHGLHLFGRAAEYSAAGVQVGLGGYQLGNSMIEFTNGDTDKAAGYLGEAALRLFGGFVQARGFKPPKLPGRWKEVARNSGDALDIQSAFSGKPIRYTDSGKAFIEEYLLDGVSFDRVDGRVLGEVKGNFSFAVRLARAGKLDFVDDLILEAQRQTAVAKRYGLLLEWHVRAEDLAGFENVIGNQFKSIIFVPY